MCVSKWNDVGLCMLVLVVIKWNEVILNKVGVGICILVVCVFKWNEVVI